MHSNGRVATLLVILVAPLVAWGDIEADNAPVDSITGARWADYQGMYEQSPFCAEDEITLWRCDKGSRHYVLCASQQVSKTSGYLQYHAFKGEREVFVYPATKRPPLGYFAYTSSANGDASLAFDNGGYHYQLIDPLRGTSYIDVSASDPQKPGAEIACESSNQSLQINYSMRLMYAAGIWQR